MSNFFGDIARSFGLIGDYFQQSAERGRQIVESKKPIQPTIQSTQPKVGDVSIGGFFGDIAQKFNLGVPELVTPKPIPEPTPVQKAISKMTTQEKWQATGQLSKDLALVFPRAVAQTTLEIVAMPKQILTGEVAKPIKVPTLLKPIFGEEMTTYALNTQRAIQSGVSPTGAVLLNGLFGAWDMAIVGSLLKFGSQAVLRDVKVPETSHYAAWETMGRPTTRAEAKQTYRGLAHTLHPDKPTGSTQAMTALNNAYKIIEKQGIPKAPPKPVQVIYDIAKTLNTPVSEIAKIPSAQPFLGVKGYLPGARPVPGQAPAFGLSVQEVERVGGKSITAKLNADIQNYKRMGVGGAGTIPINPSLVALEESSKLPEVQKITQNQVKSIPKNSDGTITVYRVGEITKPTGLVSVTYTKEAAQAFKDITFPEKIVSVTSMKIKPEDVKIFVGGAEKELLIQNPKIAQISPKIAPELETLAQEARTFESARLWKLSYEGIPADKANKIAQQLIDAGFVEKLPVGMVSKKVVPDFEGFYKIAIESIKPKMAIPKELTPLLQEARKFKSAEEFVKTKATLMRGAKTAEIRPGKVGVYLTSDRAMAETFAGKEGVITKAFADVKKTYKILKADEYEWLDALIENPKDYSKYVAELKSKGYDSILSSDKKQLLVFDRNKVLTKSQLTDFYNQAIKGIKEKPPKPEIKPSEIKPEIKPKAEVKPIPEELEPLAEEARKYKNVEEFKVGIRKKFDELWAKVKNPPTGTKQQQWINEMNTLKNLIVKEAEKRMTPKVLALKKGSQIRIWAQRDAENQFFTKFYNQATKGIKEVKPEISIPKSEWVKQLPRIEKARNILRKQGLPYATIIRYSAGSENITNVSPAEIIEKLSKSAKERAFLILSNPENKWQLEKKTTPKAYNIQAQLFRAGIIRLEPEGEERVVVVPTEEGKKLSPVLFKPVSKPSTKVKLTKPAIEENLPLFKESKSVTVTEYRKRLAKEKKGLPPVEEIKPIIAKAKWEKGIERPFAFDPNSTIN